MKRSSDSRLYYSEEEDVLAKWASACQIKCRLHRLTARHYARYSKNTTVIILILQTCAGSLTLSDDVPSWAEPLVALLQLALAVCLAIASYLKMEQRSEAHRSASISYGEIYQRLSTLLARRASERPPAVGIIDTMLQTLIQLDKNSPLLPMKLCEKESLKSRITERFRDGELPEELNGLTNINVYGRTVPEKGTTTAPAIADTDPVIENETTHKAISLSPVSPSEFSREVIETFQDVEECSTSDTPPPSEETNKA